MDWISVKDEMPTKGEKVILWGLDRYFGWSRMWIDVYVGSEKWEIADSRDIVTHWMPLPKPPKEK